MAALDLITFVCQACGRKAVLPAISVGSTFTCPDCKEAQKVTLPSGPITQAYVPPTAPVSLTPSSAVPVLHADKKLFVCTKCAYRARIPAHYIGLAVKCPSCDASQIAGGDELPNTTGRTVSITKMPSASSTAKISAIRPGNVLYTCEQCSFEAQLAERYLGKAIRCPGCQSAQIVALGITAQLPPGASVTPSEPPTAPPIATPLASPTSSFPPTTPPPPGSIPGTSVFSKGVTTPSSASPIQSLFICSACGYRARIPDHYIGQAVSCPSCEVVQIAIARPESSTSTGVTQSIVKLKVSTPVTARVIKSDDTIPFTCSTCNFTSQVGHHLAGKAIRCPECQITQVVAHAPLPPLPDIAPPSQAATQMPAQALAQTPNSSPNQATFTGGTHPSGERIRFVCKACGFKARIPEKYAGQAIHCPGCNDVQTATVSEHTSVGNTGVFTRIVSSSSSNAPRSSVPNRIDSPLPFPVDPDARTVLPPRSVPPPVVPPPIAKPLTQVITRPSAIVSASPVDTSDKVAVKAPAESTAPTMNPITKRITNRLTRPSLSITMPAETPASSPATPEPNAPASSDTNRSYQPATEASAKASSPQEKNPASEIVPDPTTDLFAATEVVDPVTGKALKATVNPPPGNVAKRQSQANEYPSNDAFTSDKNLNKSEDKSSQPPSSDVEEFFMPDSPVSDPSSKKKFIALLFIVLILTVLGWLCWTSNNELHSTTQTLGTTKELLDNERKESTKARDLANEKEAQRQKIAEQARTQAAQDAATIAGLKQQLTEAHDAATQKQAAQERRDAENAKALADQKADFEQQLATLHRQLTEARNHIAQQKATYEQREQARITLDKETAQRIESERRDSAKRIDDLQRQLKANEEKAAREKAARELYEQEKAAAAAALAPTAPQK